MGETPRMVIVPAEATEDMASGIDFLTGCGLESGEHIWDDAVMNSPNRGKISRSDLERADRAADEVRKEFINKLYEQNLPFGAIAGKSLKRAEQDAFAAALGLEIAEEKPDD